MTRIGGRVPFGRRTASLAVTPIVATADVGEMPCPDGAWTTLDTGPSSVHALAAGDSGKLIALDYSGALHEYDVMGDSWSSGLASFPVTIDDSGALIGFAASPYESFAFFTDSSGTATTYGYDNDDVWSGPGDFAPMNVPRAGFAAGRANSLIHIVGGATVPAYVSSAAHEVYNPSTDSWTTAAVVPVAVGYGSAIAEASNDLYLFANTPARAFVWDSTGDAWTELATPPWSAHTYYIVAGKVPTGDILVGNEATGEFWIYSPTGDGYFPASSPGFSAPEAHKVVGNDIYVVDFTTGGFARYDC